MERTPNNLLIDASALSCGYEQKFAALYNNKCKHKF